MRPSGWIGHTQRQILSVLTPEWMSVREIMVAAGLTSGQAHGALKGLRARQLVAFEALGAGRTAEHRYRRAG